MQLSKRVRLLLEGGVPKIDVLYSLVRYIVYLYGDPEDVVPWQRGATVRSKIVIYFLATLCLSYLAYSYTILMFLGSLSMVWSLLGIPFSLFLSTLVVNIYLWGLENDFYSSLSTEYPIFLLLFAISSRINTYSLFHLIIANFRDILKATSRVLGRWILDYELSEYSLDNVIFNSLERFRDCDFKGFIRELLRVRAYSGEVDKFLENNLENLYTDLSVNWEDNWKSTVGRLEVIMLLFGLLPSIVMSVISIAPMRLVANTFLLLILAMPVVGYGTYVYLDKSMYKLPGRASYPFDTQLFLVSLIGVVSFLLINHLMKLVPLDEFRIVAISLCIVLIYPSIKSFYAWIGERMADRDLSNFLFSVEDLMRNGFSIREAVSKIDLNGFRRGFRNVVGRLRFYLEHGDSGAINSLEAYSKLTRLTVLIISYIADIGGGLREIIFLRKMSDQYLRLKSKKASYSLFPLLTAVFIIFIGIYNYWVIQDIFLSVNTQAFPAYMGVIGLLSWVSQLYKLIFLESIFVSGILISKVIHDDVFHLYPVFILLISYIGALTLFPF